MSNQLPTPEEFEQFIRRLQGQFGSGEADNLDFGPFREMFQTIEGVMSSSGGATERPIDWATVLGTAEKQLLNRRLDNPTEAERSQLAGADRIAREWAGAASGFALSESPTEFATRGDWPKLSLDFFRTIATPIAIRSVTDAEANFRQIMPNQGDDFYKASSEKLSEVSAKLHGLQLGQFLGLISESVLSGSDLGSPAANVPVLLTDNAIQFASDNSIDLLDTAIYLLVREQLAVALFLANPWLQSGLLTQVREYAANLSFNTQGLSELQSALEGGDFEAVGEMMTALVEVSQSENQLAALARLQHLLSLIAGWTDQVAEVACVHLSSFDRLHEAYRRRRIGNSPQSRVFKLLLNFDLDSGAISKAAEFWRELTVSLGGKKRDEVLSHPDLLPSIEEVSNPNLFFERLNSAGEDELDQGLRRLIGDA